MSVRLHFRPNFTDASFSITRRYFSYKFSRFFSPFLIKNLHISCMGFINRRRLGFAVESATNYGSDISKIMGKASKRWKPLPFDIKPFNLAFFEFFKAWTISKSTNSLKLFWNLEYHSTVTYYVTHIMWHINFHFLKLLFSKVPKKSQIHRVDIKSA